MDRQADALYLAGYTTMAAAIWSVLAQLQDETSLFNLAVITEDSAQSAAFLEELVNMETDSKAGLFGLIRYSRLFDYSQAISLLRNSGMSDNPYVDLEICKRYAQSRDIGRQLAEAWLLLDRHERSEELYQWAAWLFFFQRRFDEASILLDRTELHEFETIWVDVYRGIKLMNEGDLESAEAILRGIPSEQTPWYVYANLGRIMETLRSPRHALEQYEMAATLVELPRAAAQIQLRIARCLAALNRHAEARRALQHAHEFDPENLSVRLELDRTFW
jgi:tetratricopeptide (TPR) repeat protein